MQDYNLNRIKYTTFIENLPLRNNYRLKRTELGTSSDMKYLLRSVRI